MASLQVCRALCCIIQFFCAAPECPLSRWCILPPPSPRHHDHVVQDGIAKDIAYANLIQVTLGRTLRGFVPNGSAGPKKSYDRSEPQVGARVALEIFNKWGDAWVIEGLLDTFLSWNDWVWEHRRGEGSLAGPDGHADLMCLGSDPTSPPGDTENNLQAARYEGESVAIIASSVPIWGVAHAPSVVPLQEWTTRRYTTRRQRHLTPP
jgi:hypothetical protein